MGRVSPVDKYKSAMADHFLHKRQGSYFSTRFRPPFFGHLFPETDSFINTHWMRRPMVINSMFPSLFDGIRLGRQQTPSPQLKQINNRNQHKSPNFRMIPINIERVEKHGKSTPLNKSNPIVLDDDEAEMIDITGESSASQPAKAECTCHRKPARSDSAILVDDDNHTSPVRQSSAGSCAGVKKANVRRPLIFEIVEPTSPKSRKPNFRKSQSENPNVQVSNDSIVRNGRMRADSVITLDDDQEAIHIDDVSPETGCSLQQCFGSADFKKEKARNAFEVEHLNSELKTTPNKMSTGLEADGLVVDSSSQASLNIEDNDDIHVTDTGVSGNSSPSKLSEIADCCVEELKDSPPPDYSVYKQLKTILASENRKIHYITGDGNCFFRGLSKLLYGCEVYHPAVRKLIIDVIATNKNKFAQFVDEKDVQGHIQKMSEDHCWATTCEIYAAATVLQRDIYVLTPNHLVTNYSWLLFKPVFKITHVPRNFAKHLCYITLCNTNGNHYDLIVADHGKCNCFLPHPELDGISASIDLT